VKAIIPGKTKTNYPAIKDRKKLIKRSYWLVLLSLTACGFPSGDKAGSRHFDREAFSDYWYQGKAEINTYALEQYRYGELRKGEAELIFVTEDFSREKQVKLDDPAAAGSDAQKVLKMNLVKKFITGVYPYSMMVSAFTPVYDSVLAVKIAASCQDWCGQTFIQMNHRNGAYQVEARSFFEREGDRKLTIRARAEDELWNLIRINPGQLPVGKVLLLPGLLYQRFTHEDMKAREAVITLEPAETAWAGESGLQVCVVVYQDHPRTLRIYFRPCFPYEIMGWEEEQKLKNGRTERSKATRMAVKKLDYWKKHSKTDELLRNELKLPVREGFPVQ
jgi:hypothetical protein